MILRGIARPVVPNLCLLRIIISTNLAYLRDNRRPVASVLIILNSPDHMAVGADWTRLQNSPANLRIRDEVAHVIPASDRTVSDARGIAANLFRARGMPKDFD